MRLLMGGWGVCVGACDGMRLLMGRQGACVGMTSPRELPMMRDWRRLAGS